MILMYHKIYPDSPTLWWVSVDSFYKQMCEIQHKKIVYLDDYDPNNPEHVVITFDGVYENVYKFALPILKKFNYPFELFISGDHIGKTNDFDKIDKKTGQPTNEPSAFFATVLQLDALVKAGGRLQWHTNSHPNLTILSKNQVIDELTIPNRIKKIDPKGFKWFAYPHGEYNELVITEIKKRFRGGLSVIQGNDINLYALNRITMTEATSLRKASIGVIIPCYNYGKFLPEAIESVLHQTRPVDKIIILDDCSTDNTQEIATIYKQKYPEIIQYIRNKENLGIVPNFNKGVNLIDTEYVCLLGADNRFLSSYIEKTAKILDENDSVAVAYTDFALFGPNASEMYSRMPLNRRGEIIENKIFKVHFPNFTKEAIKNLDEINFMHGSSLFKKKAFVSVGGYIKTKKAEDHNLFQRIVENGYKAKRVPEAILEYRQHSALQANTKLISLAELKFYKEEYKRVSMELQKIYSSRAWQILFFVKQPKKAIKRFTLRFFELVLKKIKNKLS